MINEIVTVRKPLIHCDNPVNFRHARFRHMIAVPIFNTIMGLAALCRKAFSDVNANSRYRSLASRFNKRSYNRYMKEQSWGMLIAISIPILGCIPGIMLCHRHGKAIRREHEYFLKHGKFSDTTTSSFPKIQIIQRMCCPVGAHCSKIPAEMFSWHENGIKISINNDNINPDLIILKGTYKYNAIFQHLTPESILKIVQSMAIAVANPNQQLADLQHELREIIKLCPEKALNSREIAVALMRIDPTNLKYCYDEAVQGILKDLSADDLSGINVNEALIAVQKTPQNELRCSVPMTMKVLDAVRP